MLHDMKSSAVVGESKTAGAGVVATKRCYRTTVPCLKDHLGAVLAAACMILVINIQDRGTFAREA